MTGLLLFPTLVLLCLVPVFVHLASRSPDDHEADRGTLDDGPLGWDASADLADVFVQELNQRNTKEAGNDKVSNG